MTANVWTQWREALSQAALSTRLAPERLKGSGAYGEHLVVRKRGLFRTDRSLESFDTCANALTGYHVGAYGHAEEWRGEVRHSEKLELWQVGSDLVCAHIVEVDQYGPTQTHREVNCRPAWDYDLAEVGVGSLQVALDRLGGTFA